MWPEYNKGGEALVSVESGVDACMRREVIGQIILCDVISLRDATLWHIGWNLLYEDTCFIAVSECLCLAGGG